MHAGKSFQQISFLGVRAKPISKIGFIFISEMEITDCKKKAIEHVKRKHEKLRKDICSHKDERKEIAGRAGIRPETLTKYTSGTHDLSKINYYSVVYAIGKKPEDYN